MNYKSQNKSVSLENEKFLGDTLQVFFKSSGFQNMNLLARKRVAHIVLDELKSPYCEIALMERITPKSMFVIDSSSYVEVNKKYVVSIRK